jgi:sugar phosphate isomerase/epimerase
LALNTSTIRPASLEDKIRVTAETGWDSIELWINDLEDHEKAGGDLADLGKQIRDRGLYVCNVIGLWNSMPATEEAFEASLVDTRNRLRMMSAVGSRYAAAIPQPDRADFDLVWATELYKRLLKIGRDDYNITVAMEFIGFFKSVYRLGQASMIALDADDADACIIADTYHLFRGGSGFTGLRHLDGGLIANFHWNDVPKDVAPEGTGDADRIYPGDGALPLEQALRDLKAIGYTRTLSLELFNRAHWEMDPKEVAATGLRKMRENIAAAGV